VAKTDFKTVDEYINTFPQDVGETLEKIRQTIQEAVPDAEEVISYQIPAFKFYGWILYFSAYKDHYSISFPPPSTVFDIFKKGNCSGHVILSEYRAKNLHETPKKRSLATPHGDSSAYGLRMTCWLNRYQKRTVRV